MIVDVGDDLFFPNPYLGNDDGFFACGGDLSLPRLRLAYANGIFPWYSYKENPRPYWCCPINRFVIFPNEVHVSHSMRTLFNKNRFEVTFDKDFVGVMRKCRSVDNRHVNKHAWLGKHVIDAFQPLFEHGWAHSVEVWEDGKMVGGLYGVQLSKEIFVGESMFSKIPSGSKVALIALARKLADEGTVLIDCQCHTPHLESMGGRFFPYSEYISILHGNKKIKKITYIGPNGFLYLNEGRKKCVNRYHLIKD